MCPFVAPEDNVSPRQGGASLAKCGLKTRALRLLVVRRRRFSSSRLPQNKIAPLSVGYSIHCPSPPRRMNEVQLATDLSLRFRRSNRLTKNRNGRKQVENKRTTDSNPTSHRLIMRPARRPSNRPTDRPTNRPNDRPTEIPRAYLLSPLMSAMQHDVTFLGQGIDHRGCTRPVPDSSSHLFARAKRSGRVRQQCRSRVGAVRAQQSCCKGHWPRLPYSTHA